MTAYFSSRRLLVQGTRREPPGWGVDCRGCDRVRVWDWRMDRMESVNQKRPVVTRTHRCSAWAGGAVMGASLPVTLSSTLVDAHVTQTLHPWRKENSPFVNGTVSRSTQQRGENLQQCGCVPELNGALRFENRVECRWLFPRWWIGHKQGGGVLPGGLSPFTRWVHDAELRRATEQAYANTSRINHNARR